MKNIVLKLVIVVMVCTFLNFNGNYNSVWAYNNKWSAQAISNFLYNKIDAPNVLQDEKYSKPITRGEFAELIVAFYAKSENIDKNTINIKINPFKDTNNLDVQRAFSLGIIQGVSKNVFKPNEYITRQEIATIITRFLNVKGISTNSNNNLDAFQDKNNVSDWAYDSLAYCVENEIIKGTNEKVIPGHVIKGMYLMPKGLATTEEVITILDRIGIKNNCIVQSQDRYINGFLIPNNSELNKVYPDSSYGLGIEFEYSEITNFEKLKNDLVYILNSKFKNEQFCNKFIDKELTQLNQSVKDKHFVDKHYMDNYEILVIGFSKNGMSINIVKR